MRRIVIVALLPTLIFAGCASRPPSRVEVTALHYEPHVITVTMTLKDSEGREVGARGRALFDVVQRTSAGGHGPWGPVSLVYHAERDVRPGDFHPALLLSRIELQCKLGEISYTDIDDWVSQHREGTEPLVSGRDGFVRARFVTAEGDTLTEAEYPVSF